MSPFPPPPLVSARTAKPTLKLALQTADCRYMVPLGWDFVPAVTCSTSFSSIKISTTEEFKSSFSEEASVEGGGWGASFSASESYKVRIQIAVTGKQDV